MHRSRAALFAVLWTCPALSGCELVFGLDDYAQAESGTTTGTTGTEVGPATGTGSSSSRSSDATGTGGDGGGGSGAGEPSSSTAGGDGGGDCPCVPEGWTLVAAQPTTADAPPGSCPSGTTADRVQGEATVACECTCGVTENLESRLGCWSDADCTGVLSLLDSSLCGTMPPAKSCQRVLVKEGAPAAEICVSTSAVLGTGADNVFDVCVAPPDGVSCGEEGVCEPAAPGSLWCIEGPIDEACPGAWPDDHTLSEGGTATCDCACTDDVTADGAWSVANPNDACFNQNTDVDSRACQNVPDLSRFHGGPPLGDQIGGGCTPVQMQPAGRFEGATEARLCCRPQ